MPPPLLPPPPLAAGEGQEGENEADLSLSITSSPQQDADSHDDHDDDDEGVMDVPTCFHPSPLLPHRQASLDIEGGRSLSMTGGGEGGEGEEGVEEDMHMRTLRLTQHLDLDDGHNSSSNDKAATTVSYRSQGIDKDTASL